MWGMMKTTTLVFNAGSSSLKYELLAADESTLVDGTIGRIGSKNADSTKNRGESTSDHNAALERALAEIDTAMPANWRDDVAGVGHRVVHGGPALFEPTPVDYASIAELERVVDLAPLHNRPALAVIKAARKLLPDVPHVMVFDTSFHHNLPVVARTYALPRAITEKWRIRRYGFHGISCAYLTGRVRELGIVPARRMAICHLGSGASVTAVLDGQSIDTSMGFTPLEGLVMGTRSGDVDPSLTFFLQRQAGYSVDEVEQILDHQSGLLGLSGTTADYGKLTEQAEHGSETAQLALDVFAYRVRKYLGAYWAALGGLDLIVFSGGIGENAPAARTRIIEPLAEVGWRIDPAANSSGAAERCISPPDAHPSIWVIPTRETLTIARDMRDLITSPKNQH